MLSLIEKYLVRHRPIFSGIIGIAFIVVLQVFATPQPVFRFLIPAFIGYLIVVSLYNYVIIRAEHSYSHWMMLRPVLFFLGWFGLYFIIPNEFWRGLFLLASFPVIYVIERMIGHPGEQLLFNETLLTSFAGFMTLTALSHYFPLTGTLYLALIFGFSLALVRSSYDLMPQSPKYKWLYALVLALLMTQLFWVLSFLPLHFSALALLLFNVFVCIWTITYNFLYNHLTRQKVQFQLGMAVLFTLIILAATPWQILQ